MNTLTCPQCQGEITILIEEGFADISDTTYDIECPFCDNEFKFVVYYFPSYHAVDD